MADSDGNVSDSPRVNNPLWSLDGEFLLMSVGVSATSAIVWHDEYSTVPQEYTPIFIGDVITANSEGFMYVLPKDARDVVFLQDQSYPTIAGTSSDGNIVPYRVPALHIDSRASLVEYVEPLEEDITPVSSNLSGTVIYLQRKKFNSETANNLTILAYDLASRTESVLFQKRGDEFDDDNFFAISKGNDYVAHWHSESFEEKNLIVYDSAGTQLVNYQILSEARGGREGKVLTAAPQFSPQNPDLLLLRFIDVSDGDRVKIGALNWRTGNYELFQAGAFSSATWQEDGSVVASIGRDIYRYEYQNGQFSNPVKLFSTPNVAIDIDVSVDQKKLAFRMAGHIFWSNIDGTNLTQLTTPSTGFESAPSWSPDGKHITFAKGLRRYIISAASQNARISPDFRRNTDKTLLITTEGRSIAHWTP